MWNCASRRRSVRRALVLAASAAICLGPIETRAGAPATCPAAASTDFANNGAEAPLAEPTDGWPLKILAIGSSSTLGVGASNPNAAYPAQLEARLSNDWGVSADVVNAGVGGETSDTTLKRLFAALAGAPPDLIVWQVGTNDAVDGVDPESFRANLAAGVAAAQARRVAIVLVDPQFYFGIKNLARFQQYVTIIADVGATRHVPVFSRFAMMKAWAAKSTATLRAALAPDGFHMDDVGYACFARALAGDLARLELRADEPAEKL
jgi:lysophospholipase L1-like esterase